MELERIETVRDSAPPARDEAGHCLAGDGAADTDPLLPHSPKALGYALAHAATDLGLATHGRIAGADTGLNLDGSQQSGLERCEAWGGSSSL